MAVTAPRPKNLDGEWSEPRDVGHGYVGYYSGRVQVRFDDVFEPDGELVSGPVRSVHMERMSSGHWSLILSNEDGSEVHVSLHSKKRIDVLWSDQP